MTKIFAYRNPSGIRVPCVRTPQGLFEVNQTWPELLGRMAQKHPEPASIGQALPLDTKTCAPMPQGGTIYAIGVNYADHAVAGMQVMRNMGFKDPKVGAPRPVFFTKPTGSCLADSGAQVSPPAGCDAFDVEVEFCAIIGRQGKHIATADALDHVAGYTIALDMSARDFQMLPGTLFGVDLFSGKVFDGACPMGPYLYPAKHLSDPGNLDIGVSVNGEVWQQANTAQMTLALPGIIAALSKLVTLQVGDAILTGTPAGTGFETGKKLHTGDKITAWIDQLGELSINVGPPSVAKTT